MHSIQSAPQYVFLHVSLMQRVFAENQGLKKLASHRQFMADYDKYLRKMRKKMDGKQEQGKAKKSKEEGHEE